MSRRLNKRMIACVTAAFTMVVMCGAPAVAFASDGSSVTKDETVYVVTDADGTVNDTIVSDHLINDNDQDSIADKSNLTNIENVKGDEKFTRDGSNLTWNAGGNDIYYQGKTKKSVPVTMDVSYYLNGRKVQGKKLKNATGDVKIVIRYSNSTKVPFIAMTGLIADSDSFKNVDVSSGKVINDGDRLVIACLAAPGLCSQLDVTQDDLGFGDNVVITGQANKFDAEDLMTVVSGDVSDLDFDDIDVDELNSDMDKLDSSAKKLKEGSKDLKNGTSQIKSGTAKLKESLKEAADGAKSIFDGLTDMSSKIDASGSGLKDAAATADDGITKINGEAADASGHSSQAYEALYAIKDDTNLTDEQKNAINGAITAINSSKGLTDTIKGQTMSNALKPNYKNATAGVSAGITSLSTALDNQLVPGTEELYNKLTEGLPDAQKLSDGADEVDQGASDLSDGMSKFYKDGIKKLVDMYNDDLKNTIEGLDDALDAGKDYKTFTQLPGGMDGSVKFIYKTPIYE